MDDKVKELVEWVAEIIRYADTSENPVLIPDSLREDYLKAAKQILSHPDLALIDRSKKYPLYNTSGDVYQVLQRGQNDMIGMGFKYAVIPLAEALEEVRGHKIAT